jgi:hypothetical protein
MMVTAFLLLGLIIGPQSVFAQVATPSAGLAGAVEATDSGGGGAVDEFDVTDYGATVGDGLNDRVGINLAVAAACANGGGTIVLPAGVYDVGTTGANAFYSGVQIECSNVTFKGASAGGTIIRPLFTNGGALLSMCPEFNNSPNYGFNTTTCPSAGAARIENITVEDLTFIDPDPASHVQGYDPGTGKATSEEVHAIFARHVNNLIIRNVVVNSMGDEGMVIEADGALVYDNTFINTPAIRGSSGAAVEFFGSNGVFRNNVIRDVISDPLGDGAACTGGCVNNSTGISIPTNTLIANHNLLIEGNHLYNIENHQAIAVVTNGATNNNIRIINNVVDYTDNTIGCHSSPSDTTPSHCAVLLGGTFGTTLGHNDIVIEGNYFNAGVVGVLGSGFGPVTIENNRFDLGGTHDKSAINMGGSPLVVRGNYVTNAGGSFVTVAGADDVNEVSGLHFDNNIVDGACLSGTACAAIQSLATCAGSVPHKLGTVVSNNKFIFGVGSNVNNAMNFHESCKSIAINNLIDLTGNEAVSSSGINRFHVVTGNTIRSPASYCITGASADGATFSGNHCQDPGNRGFNLGGSDYASITDNTFDYAVGTGGVAAVDAGGVAPVCIGNISTYASTAARYGFSCGTDGAGAGCNADTVPSTGAGQCDFNRACATNGCD